LVSDEGEGNHGLVCAVCGVLCAVCGVLGVLCAVWGGGVAVGDSTRTCHRAALSAGQLSGTGSTAKKGDAATEMSVGSMPMALCGHSV